MDGLRIHVLGTLEVEGIAPADLGSRKARTLLKVLVLARGRAVSVDRLTEVLWGDAPPARPADQVSVLVSRLRRVIGAHLVARTDAGYSLAADWVDVHELEIRVDEAAAHLEAGRLAAAGTVSRGALALLRGILLADEADPWWAEAERLAVARLAARARLVVADAALRSGDPLTAAEHAAAAHDHDPYDESALRLLMRAHVAAGRPGSALAAYAATRARLADDLGTSPTSETEDLHTAVLRDELEPVAGTGSAGTAGTAGASGPVLAGRAAELDAIDAEMTRAASTGVVLTVVEGDAGIGKTALIEAWIGRARGGGAIVLTGRSDPMGLGLPFQPIADAIDVHLRSLEPDAATAVLGDEAPALAGVLGRGRSRDTIVSPVLDPDQGQAIVFEALLDVLLRSAGVGPAVLVVDDVHLAGASTLEWLHFAVRRGAGRPALIVVTRRSGDDGSVRLPGRRITLGPVDLAAAETIVGTDRAADLHERSGGHPLFLVELAQAPPGRLPDTIREMVARQCDAAGPEVATTLRTAALLGPDIDLDLLSATRLRPPTELVDQLEAGLRLRLLEEQGDGFGFRHEMVREALAVDVSSPRRALVHRQAAIALARRPDADPLDIAHHAHLAGDRDLEAEANERAAVIAIDRFDYVAAENLLGRAIAGCDTIALRLQRARTRMMMRLFDDAQHDVDHAVAAGAGAEAFEVAAWIAYYRRDLPSAVRLAGDGAEAARRAGDDAQLSRCLAVLGRSHHSLGQVDEAERDLRQAVALARGQDAATARVWLGILEVHRNELEAALELFGPAHHGSGGVGLSFAPPYATIFTAYALAMSARTGEALDVLDHVGEVVRRRGTSRLLGVPDNFRGWILRNLGAYAEADDTNEAALAAVPTEGIEPNVHAELDLMAGRVMIGDAAGARRRLATLERSLRAWKTFVWRSELRRIHLTGRLSLLEEDWDGARQRAAELTSMAESKRSPRYEILGGLLDAEAAIRSGDGVERKRVDALLRRLPRVAPLESWWLIADLASAAADPRWRAMVDERATAIAAGCGRYAETIIRAAEVRSAPPR